MANRNQADFDNDSLGDACDPDIDGDGILNASDLEADGDRVMNTDETNCGGNPLDSLVRPERIDVDFPKDDDADTVVNEPLPGTSGPYDCDGDGWIGNQEGQIFGDAPTDRLTNSGTLCLIQTTLISSASISNPVVSSTSET